MKRGFSNSYTFNKNNIATRWLRINYEVPELNMGEKHMQLPQIELKHIQLKYILMVTSASNFSLINDKQREAGDRGTESRCNSHAQIKLNMSKSKFQLSQ